MEVKELKNEGLSREFEISVPAEEILKGVEDSLKKEQEEFKMPGFRDGKAPMSMIKKKIGTEVLAQEIERKVDETLQTFFKERNFRPAMQPNVEIKNFDEKGVLSFTLSVELFPEVPAVDWSVIELEQIKVVVGDEDIAKAHEDIMKNFKNFSNADDATPAKKGDAVIIDFVGTVNGVEFDGGKGEGIRLEIGSNQFIPGFEEQLINAKKGSNIKVRVTFPKNYSNKELAGKPAIFDVTVQQIMKPETVGTINDEFAKQLGVDSLEKLNELIKQKIESDYAGLARLRLKKTLFDQIDAVHKFEIPEGMFKMDFDAMWTDMKVQKENNPQAFKGKNEAQLRDEYTAIAQRRVRLGIILAEIARENNIEVGEADLQQAIYSEAMMRPGQEKIILDFYAKKENLERLKGPILEEKAVDFILEKVQKKEIEVSSKEFFEQYAEEFDPANAKKNA